MSAGKGDSPRPYSTSKYAKGYSAIKWNKTKSTKDDKKKK